MKIGSVIMIVIGIILLLPGVCSLGFSGLAIYGVATQSGGTSFLNTVIPFSIIGFAISAGGIVLIRQAWKKRT
jgi:hypothetical protein